MATTHEHLGADEGVEHFSDQDALSQIASKLAEVRALVEGMDDSEIGAHEVRTASFNIDTGAVRRAQQQEKFRHLAGRAASSPLRKV